MLVVSFASRSSFPGVVTAEPTFTFGAGGDVGIGAKQDAVLRSLASGGTSFFLHLGDLDYDLSWTDPQGRTYDGKTDSDYCRFVTDRVGSAYPYEIVSGNHEDDFGPHGRITDHVLCLPDRLGSVGVYGAEYYFDYPATTPLVRVIMVAAGSTVAGVSYDYSEIGTMRYAWLQTAIRSARTANIPWVVVGMHKNCITAGVKSCEVSTTMLDLLLNEKVDLILQGHDHNYQRSKQLTCAARNAYVDSCVVDDGADGSYVKGRGSIINIIGTSGRCCHAVNSSDSEAGYFAATYPTTTPYVNGWGKFSVSQDRMDVTFIAAQGGTFTDGYSIVEGTPPPPLQGDVNGDCVVNFVDLGRVGSSFLKSTGQPGYDPEADLNLDGVVNFVDLGIVGANFLKSCL